MGCNHSSDKHPRMVVGSTMISAGGDLIMLGQEVIIPLEDKDTNESSVIKIDLKLRKYEILKGFHGKFYKSLLSKKEDKQNNNTIEEESIHL